MGKIYDNWGILVEAVQRRERDHELAMCHSRDPSFISNDGSSSSSSTRFSFDMTNTRLFINKSNVHSMNRQLLVDANNFLGVDHYYHWDITSPLDTVSCHGLEDELLEVFSWHSTSPTELAVELTNHEFNSEEFIFITQEFNHITHAAVYDLRGIAERMIAEGYLREYVQVYTKVCKSFMDANLKKLNVDELSFGNTGRLDWETLVTMVSHWKKVAKLCVRVLFTNERSRCKKLFEGLENSTSADDVCFMETFKGYAIQLFNFADAISISERSPERLFTMLDIHDTLSELLPDIESVFDSKFGESIGIWVNEILSRLAEAVREIMLEFENLVFSDPAVVPVPGGTVHPLTRYVMDYVSALLDNKTALLELIVSKPPSLLSRYSSDPTVSDMDLAEFEGNESALALHLKWIMVILQFNLSGKSKHYKLDSMAHFFMMNNVHYIFLKIRNSPELREIIGDTYLKRLIENIGSAATYYQRATWSRLLHCLSDDGIHVRLGLSTVVLKERFKSFNAIFEEVRRTQAMWLIPDTQLREELRISISETLIPAYRSFYGRFGDRIEYGKNPQKYIKYTVEDLEKSLFEDFFEETPVSRRLSKAK